jgi:iron complex outermembrane recepter protein
MRQATAAATQNENHSTLSLFSLKKPAQREGGVFKRTGYGPRAFLTATLLGLASLSPAADAMDNRLNSQTSFNIPAQPLGQSLKQLADQAGIQIFFEEQLVSGLKAAAIKTRETPLQTLNTLLTGTGLEFAAEDQTIAVRRKSTDTTSTSGEDQQGGVGAADPPESRSRVADNPNILEEIVVTIQKRVESLQDVPASVTAKTGEQLSQSGVNGTADLAVVIPSLAFVQATNEAEPRLRGIGTNQSGPGAESEVPLYVDGVYQSSMFANVFDLFDVKQVEVLRGPQGTLFGRNAVGGAISITTLDPSSEPEIKVGVSYGRFNELISDLYMTGQLANGITASLSVHGSQSGGYINNLSSTGAPALGQSTDQAGRLKIVWEQDSTRLRWMTSVNKSNSNAAESMHPIDGDTVARAIDPHVIVPTGYSASYSPGVYPSGSISQFTTAIDEVIHFSGFDFTAIGSYQRSQTDAVIDADGTTVSVLGYNLRLFDRAYTGEARVVSTMPGAFRWLAGLFYFNDDAAFNPLNIFGISQLTPVQTANAYAAFGEGSYDLTDRLAATVGLRGSTERRTLDQTIDGTFLGSASADFSNVSKKIDFQYRFLDNLRGHVGYNQGYKSGLFNASNTALPLTPVQPEKLDAYEAGLKSEPTQQIQANASVFYYNYKNLQVNQIVNSISQITNAAAVRDYGGELEVTARVTPAWKISGNVAYSHARFTSYNDGIVYVPTPNGEGNVSKVVDATGNPLPYSPDLSAAVSTDYTIALPKGRLLLSGNIYHSGSYWWTVGKVLQQPSYEVLNAQVTWISPGDNLRLSIWGNNIADKQYYQYVLNSQVANLGVLARPATAGIKIIYSMK